MGAAQQLRRAGSTRQLPGHPRCPASRGSSSEIIAEGGEDDPAFLAHLISKREICSVYRANLSDRHALFALRKQRGELTS